MTGNISKGSFGPYLLFCSFAPLYLFLLFAPSATKAESKKVEFENFRKAVLSVIESRTQRGRDGNTSKALAEIWQFKPSRKEQIDFIFEVLRKHGPSALFVSRTLSNIDDKQLITSLLPMLKDQNHIVRASTALTLGRLKYHPALRPLLNLLGDPNPLVVMYASSALAEIGDKAIVPEMAKKLGRRERDSIGMLGLAKFGKVALDCILVELAQIAESSDPREKKRRLPLVHAIASIEDPEAAPQLYKLLTDNHDWEIRLSALEALIGSGKLSSGLVKKILKDKSTILRERALREAGETDGKGFDEVIIDALMNDPSENVAGTAAESLAQRIGKKAIPHIEKASKRWAPSVPKGMQSILAELKKTGSYASESLKHKRLLEELRKSAEKVGQVDKKTLKSALKNIRKSIELKPRH